MEKTIAKEPEGRSCMNCRFKDVVAPAGGGILSICRNRPPVVIGGPIGQGNQIGFAAQSQWPVIGPGDWCGEHERELAATL